MLWVISSSSLTGANLRQAFFFSKPFPIFSTFHFAYSNRDKNKFPAKVRCFYRESVNSQALKMLAYLFMPEPEEKVRSP